MNRVLINHKLVVERFARRESGGVGDDDELRSCFYGSFSLAFFGCFVGRKAVDLQDILGCFFFQNFRTILP